MNPDYWVLYIDTDSYAGNFERDMTAYCTGIFGECEVGRSIASLYLDEEDYEFELLLISDDHGCHRPTSMFTEEGTTDYHTVGIFFNAKPTEEEIAIVKRRSAIFALNEYEMAIHGFRLGHIVTKEEIVEV